MGNITDIFVDHLFRMSRTTLAPVALEQARLCLLDYRACVRAGIRLSKEHDARFEEIVAKQGGTVSVEGLPFRTTLHNAAFLNAMHAHAAELDDGHRRGQIHLGASILSALLPVAELEGLAAEDLMRGIVVGYEAAIRLAMAMNPAHKLRGYHTSGTCGTIGVAMGIAAALHYEKQQMKAALSAATASAAGLLEMQEDGSELKPYNLAQAAVGGITAAYSAMAGYKGPEDALGGKRGMLAVMTDQPAMSFLTEFDGMEYQIEGIYRKPYAACRHGHAAIEAALRLKQDYDLKPSGIRHILIETYGMAIKGHDHKMIQGIPSAKMSIPFSVALALFKGAAGVEDYNESTIHDPDILALAGRVEMTEDPEIASWIPAKRAARVTISASGGIFRCQVDFPKGEPENPMTESEIKAKLIGV